ncbi:MAG TPA: hypothetical protein VKZ53_08965 [Candidatus Angelobacter sp.]|nr:hypothetical protein [Candidatus Angelobacter sp.]
MDDTKLATILFAESDPILLGLVSEGLALNHYHVLPAGTVVGIEQSSTAWPGKIDLLLIDFFDFLSDDRDFLQHLTARRRNLPVLLTGHWHIDSLLPNDQVLAAVNHYLRKPFSLAVLVEKIQSILHSPDALEMEPLLLTSAS